MVNFLILLSSIFFVNEEVYVVFLHEAEEPGLSNQKEIKKSHLEYLEGLRKAKILLLNGIIDKKAEFLIFDTILKEEVVSTLNNDPLIKSGLYKPEIFRSTIRHGKVCDTSKNSFEELSLIRYTSHITKFNVQEAPSLLKIHDDYINKIIATGNVLLEGVFSNSDGSFMIIEGEVGKEVVYSDPTVAAGFLLPEMHKFYIRQGLLCRNNEP